MSAYNMPDNCSGLPPEDFRVTNKDILLAEKQLQQYIETLVTVTDYKLLCDIADLMGIDNAKDVFSRAIDFGVNENG